MRFSNKLQKLRKKAGLSQEELGEKLNVTRQTVSKWELGQSLPDTNKMLEISKFFNVSIDDLTDNNMETQNHAESYKDPDDIKPRKWLLVLFILVAIAIVVVLVNKIIIIHNENKEKGTSIFNVDYNKKSFNNGYEFYAGTTMGASVYNALDDVITNNKKSDKHIISVQYKETSTSNPEEIKKLKSSFSMFNSYEVSIDYDENGFVNKITIEDIAEEKKDISVNSFNIHFTGRNGTKYGSSVGYILDDVIDSNKKYPNHQINVVYNTTNTSNPDEIKKLKKSLDTWTQYEVSIDYDENGYINLITIEK